ncbi:MAG TPA: allantoinase AllB [Thermoanaerobaculia bacterium]|jgi:allantoinase|nr:allantoinase AllB [Thermoanaerobaculia bacterium]
MNLPDLIVRGHRVITPEGEISASIHIRDGRIERLAPFSEVSPRVLVIEAETRIVMPGIVDTHVHVNEPGRTDWEGFATATRAAAAGGVTTLVDMPLNSIPATTTRAALREKILAAEGQCQVDVGFWGGIVPGNANDREEIAGLVADGVLGFKAFLVPSGVDEFPGVGEAELRPAMKELARHGAVLLVHAELPGPIEVATKVWDGAAPAELRQYDRWLRSRPAAAEVEAFELMVRLVRETGCRVHIVHLATPEVLPALRAARAEGLPITVETCPHYLTFCAEEIPDGATAFKCAPPIRGRVEREALWQALKTRDIDLVATDHSPSPPELKHLDSGDYRAAWGGIASLQLSLPAVWTGARERGCSISDLAIWMCLAPARLAGIDDRKGSIAPGYDADLVIWEPESCSTIDPAKLEHRHKLTPYAGRELYGVVRLTLLRGKTVYHDGVFFNRFSGRHILREGR